jgi:Tol biopolymer transport system component
MKKTYPAQMMRRALLVFLALWLLESAQAGPTPGATPAGNGKIAFVAGRSDSLEIYVMDANGANRIPLTNNSAIEFSPAWSPDGTKIAFGSLRDGNQQIYLMDANGSNQTRLTNTSSSELTPAWSPDGTKIVFSSDRDGNHEIYVMDANGSNQTRLTNDPAGDAGPSWSPDGTKILFTSFRDFNTEVYVMDASGFNQTALTNHSEEDGEPSWSPDGTKIAFQSSRDGHSAIYVMEANGSNPTRLTNGLFGDIAPAWSPDGTKIVFTSWRDLNNEIYMVDANGANQVRVTDNPPDDTSPDWQRVPQALNISTRMRVQTGDNVLIGGFIITGNAPKNVAVRGIGPSLAQFGISDALADPTLELRDSGGALVMQNDNWQNDPSQAAQLTALGLALQDPNESGIVASLSPNAYTAILAGNGGGIGVGLVEVYDVSQSASAQLANISTRGFVLTDNNVMIGGFILGGTNNTDVVVRGIGPSLAQIGLNPVLADPVLALHDGNGALVLSNNDWQDDPGQAAQLSAHGLALQDPNESGIFASLPPGAFTAILSGNSGGAGIGLVEIYNVQ